MPVAVSVPQNAKISVSMKVENWAFGEIIGRAVGAHAEPQEPKGL